MVLTVPPSIVKKHIIPLFDHRANAADVLAGAGQYFTAPFRGRVIGAVGGISAFATFTDVDVDVKIGSNSVLEAPIPVVDGGAIKKAAADIHKGASATLANTKFNVGDRLDLDLNATGTPGTYTGAGCYLIVVEEDGPSA